MSLAIPRLSPSGICDASPRPSLTQLLLDLSLAYWSLEPEGRRKPNVAGDDPIPLIKVPLPASTEDWDQVNFGIARF
ncbi:hypothetical protein DO97_03795 [Neosynechococcus sphagnicola sy1]|uniref:Uncharacterized protein n=1 Tax=Neosynechococcus sphagnicola sy1 TaxID=1497020 RepID=A0A098TKN8_9CYAN|nr:hypothetical protein DO97_03795 [Neosynechococcus sphagnicola sy1]